MVGSNKLLKYGSSFCLLLWSAACHPAADPTDTFQPFVSETAVYDDNLFRLPGNVDPGAVLPAGTSKSDVINQLSAGGTINYALSRQKFVVDLRVDDNRFVHNEDLNNVSTNDRATWYWELGRQLSGDGGYGYKRSLAPFTYNRTFSKDIITENNAFFDLDYAWHPRWKMTTGARWLESTHSNEVRAILNRQSATGLIGLNYTTPSNNSTGIEYKFADVDLPNRPLNPAFRIDNHYQVQTVSAVLAWNVTEKTRLDGRFGYTSLENRQFTDRDFSGETWHLTLGWAPTVKTQFSLDGWRELEPSQLVNATYVVSEGVSFSPMWSATAKLAVEAKIAYETRDYTGDPGLGARGGQRHDKVLSGQVAVVYTPIRNAEVSLAYLAEERDSTSPFANYTDNSLFASAKLKF
ncbi:MAG TPA: XrtB/PEP-CTERM-associated polysaccharide biosynthesis outer membrane protein EpsL [Methylococcaceae bacterium]|nr:XrtB/PEP-CTERM-associated polysaccharide biosynthesis outer membrane protein EpsL [Methylococcaceae bacterium]